MLPTFNSSNLHTRKRGDLSSSSSSSSSSNQQQQQHFKSNKSNCLSKIVYLIIGLLLFIIVLYYLLFNSNNNIDTNSNNIDTSTTTITTTTNNNDLTITTNNDDKLVSNNNNNNNNIENVLVDNNIKSSSSSSNNNEPQQHPQPNPQEQTQHEQTQQSDQQVQTNEPQAQPSPQPQAPQQVPPTQQQEVEHSVVEEEKKETPSNIPPPLLKREKTEKEKQQDLIFEEIAKLLTNPDQTSEGSYGWYRKQLDTNNRLGNTLFEDPIMTKLGFQDTVTTSEVLFHYFRTFNTTQECKHQHSCKIYADKTAGEFLERGTQLDAVLLHCFYRPPYFLNSHEQETKHLNVFHSLLTSTTNLNLNNNENNENNNNLNNNNNNLNNLKNNEILKHSNEIDYLYGEQMWRGMRRLVILMCSEALVISQIKDLIQDSNDYQSMERFAQSPADISICFLSTCSIWVNYQYWPLSLSKSKQFGTINTFKNNKGICAFISNCDRGGYELKERYQLLVELSKYIPVRQYGRCGKNAQEGEGGKAFEIENNCRFYYAAENSIIKDYVTEKFFEGIKALQNGAKVMMLYRGAPNLRQDWGFPKSFYLDHNDFESIEELGEYLKKMNENDDKFEEWFNKITMKERKKIDKAIDGFEYRLGTNIPCRICSIIGDMKLARYLLFKIGLKPNRPRIHLHEWQQFKLDTFENLEPERIEILDQIYHMAYNIFQYQDNKKNKYNLGWDFEN